MALGNGDRRDIYRGKVVDLGIETASPPGHESFALEIVRHPGGAAVAAIDDRQQLCLLRQYRYAAGGFIWELPAGKIDNREPPLNTAKRELREEAGVTAKTWLPLGYMWSSPGFCDERIYLFLAQKIEIHETQREANEIIEVEWVPFDRAMAMAHSGDINDAKSLAALFRAAKQLDS